MSITKKISNINIKINKNIKIPKTYIPFVHSAAKIEQISVVYGGLDKEFYCNWKFSDRKIGVTIATTMIPVRITILVIPIYLGITFQNSISDSNVCS